MTDQPTEPEDAEETKEKGEEEVKTWSGRVVRKTIKFDNSWDAPKSRSSRVTIEQARFIATDDESIIPEPTTYKAAMQSAQKSKWEEAVRSRMESLAENDVMEVCFLPKGRTSITAKWVFRVKKNRDGNVNKFKARLLHLL